MKQHSNNNISYIRTFIHLDDQLTNTYLNDFDIIFKYVFNCCGLDISSGTSFKALCLRHLLNTANTCLQTPVPSVSATEQYVRRNCIQVRYLWELSHLERNMPYPTLCGWNWSSVSIFSYTPLCQDYNSTDFISLLKTCLFTKGSCDNCSCKKRDELFYKC